MQNGRITSLESLKMITFYKLWVDDFTPSVLALHIRSVGKMASDKIPPLTVDFHKSSQFLIL